ncbi:MAG: ribbon-helix-helix protein, CopG family [Phycicoccus sp.]
MRTTVTIDDNLLAQVKVMAARQHRSVGAVLEDGVRRLIDDEATSADSRATWVLHTFEPADGGLRDGVDLDDKELMSELLDS